VLKFISESIEIIKVKQGMGYIIRRMRDEDITQVLEIDREAFPSQWPHPTYTSIRQELRNRLACYIVAAQPMDPKIEDAKQDDDDKRLWHRILRIKYLFGKNRLSGKHKTPPYNDYIVGMAGFWTMVDEAHIITVATRNTHQRQGIGELLLISIVDVAAQSKANIVTLEVRVSNKPAQALYEKYGFQKVGLRRRYYTDNGEDALIMTIEDINSALFQSGFQQLKEAHHPKRAELYT